MPKYQSTLYYATLFVYICIIHNIVEYIITYGQVPLTSVEVVNAQDFCKWGDYSKCPENFGHGACTNTGKWHSESGSVHHSSWCLSVVQEFYFRIDSVWSPILHNPTTHVVWWSASKICPTNLSFFLERKHNLESITLLFHLSHT